jgi:sugar lactone lactonase YvrE
VESLLVAGLKDAGDGLLATQVALSYPVAIARLSDGSTLIAERNGYRVRRVWPDGKITTYAGKDGTQLLGDNGPAGDAWIDRPTGLAVDAQDNVYISDFGNNRIRKVDAKTGVITSVAGQDAANPVEHPEDITLDGQNRIVFRCKAGLLRLEADGKLKVLASQAEAPAENITTGPEGKVYGYNDDTGGLFTLEQDKLQAVPGWTAVPFPEGRHAVAVAADGTVFLSYNDKLYRYKNGTGTQVTLPDGLNTVGHLLVVAQELYFADPEGNRVWRMPLAGGTPTLVAGQPIMRADGVKPEALALNRPSALLFDAAGNLYVADGGAAVIWQRRADGLYYRFAGSIDVGTATDVGDGKQAREARLGKVLSLSSRPNGNILLVDLQLPATVRVREIGTDGIINTLTMPEGIVAPAMIAVEADGSLLISDYLIKNVVRVKGTALEEIIPAGKLDQPAALLPQPDGSFYVCDTGAGLIYKVVGKALTVVAGSTEGFSGDGGAATSAQLNHPLGLIQDTTGNLYIADSRNDRIRRVNKATGTIETIAGAGGKTLIGSGVDDSLKEPLGMAFDKDVNLYVTDSAHNQIKVIKAELLK